MSTNLFVASLDFSVTDQDLHEAFSPYGTVNSAKVITDRETQRSRGFGFVEMSTPEEAQAAISALNGQNINGRQIAVNIAKPQGEGGGGGGGGRPSRGGGGGGGGYNRGNRY